MDILSYQLETEQQFWEELEDISSKDYHSTSTVERTLSAYVRFAGTYMETFLSTDEDLTRCAQALIRSSVFSKNRAYVRRTLISSLVLEELDLATKVLIGAVLLLDGRLHQSTLEMMHEEKATGAVISILWKDRHSNIRLHRIYLELLYELCRVQKLGNAELCCISEEFIVYVLSVIQNQVDYDNDPYGLAAMKVLLALNEQYMVAALTMYDGNRVENRSFKVLKETGDRYRAFGENLVFLLNRGPDRCLQLMSLKLLYLLFTTRETYQYIYLNDLKVLVSVIIRELLDLPAEEETLRHTYLRILHPLLLNTQIREEGYRRAELVSLLVSIADPHSHSAAPLGEETRRLASRCLTVDWLEYSLPCTPVTSAQDEGVLQDDESDDSVDDELILQDDTVDGASHDETLKDHTKLFVKPLTKKLPPPAPGPRKLMAMKVRNTSETEIATIRKVPPPPPPRSRSLTPLQSNT
jgi:hypothetical protein